MTAATATSAAEPEQELSSQALVIQVVAFSQNRPLVNPQDAYAIAESLRFGTILGETALTFTNTTSAPDAYYFLGRIIRAVVNDNALGRKIAKLLPDEGAPVVDEVAKKRAQRRKAPAKPRTTRQAK